MRLSLNSIYSFMFFIFYIKINNIFDNLFVKLIVVFVLILFFLKISLKKGSTKKFIAFISENKIIFIYILLLIISLIRSGHPNSSLISKVNNILMFILFILILCFGIINNFQSALLYSEHRYYLILKKTIIYPMYFYSLLNFAFYFASISLKTSVLQEGAEAKSVLLSYLGLDLSRVQFPLVSGFNSYGVLVGALFLIIGLEIILYKKKSIINLSIFFVFFVQLLLIDTRTAFFISFFILLIIVLNQKTFKIKKNSIIKFIPYCIILGPILYVVLLPIIAEFTFVSEFSRNAEEIKTGNQRFLIWAIALEHLINFDVIHLFGYGEFGHFSSGASLKWSFLFETWENGGMTSPHNSMLSTIFDIGYLGLFFFTGSFVNSINRIYKYFYFRPKNSVIYISFYCYTIFLGITDTNTGFYFDNFINLLLIVFIVESFEAQKIKKLNNNFINKY
jgi:O-antigen ligase